MDYTITVTSAANNTERVLSYHIAANAIQAFDDVELVKGETAVLRYKDSVWGVWTEEMDHEHVVVHNRI